VSTVETEMSTIADQAKREIGRLVAGHTLEEQLEIVARELMHAFVQQARALEAMRREQEAHRTIRNLLETSYARLFPAQVREMTLRGNSLAEWSDQLLAEHIVADVQASRRAAEQRGFERALAMSAQVAPPAHPPAQPVPDAPGDAEQTEPDAPEPSRGAPAGAPREASVPSSAPAGAPSEGRGDSGSTELALSLVEQLVVADAWRPEVLKDLIDKAGGSGDASLAAACEAGLVETFMARGKSYCALTEAGVQEAVKRGFGDSAQVKRARVRAAIGQMARLPNTRDMLVPRIATLFERGWRLEVGIRVGEAEVLLFTCPDGPDQLPSGEASRLAMVVFPSDTVTADLASVHRSINRADVVLVIGTPAQASSVAQQMPVSVQCWHFQGDDIDSLARVSV